MPISVSSGHFALRYEVPKFLARGGHLCMAVLTIAVVLNRFYFVTGMPVHNTVVHVGTVCFGPDSKMPTGGFSWS
eukprot:COSAG05_NODE_19061_length_298_cov_0.869347_1_plen_75_part_00